jgi:hypothetical protein
MPFGNCGDESQRDSGSEPKVDRNFRRASELFRFAENLDGSMLMIYVSLRLVGS